jgi:hypothetical protein
MVISLSVLAAFVCTIAAVICWVSIRNVRFKNGRTYAIDELGEYDYGIAHGKIKFAAGVLFFALCIAGLLASFYFFLSSLGASLFLIEKLAAMVACLVSGWFIYEAALGRPNVVQSKMTLAEVIRQGLFMVGVLLKGAAWLMLYWIAVDWSSLAAVLVGIAGILWAMLKVGKGG